MKGLTVALAAKPEPWVSPGKKTGRFAREQVAGAGRGHRAGQLSREGRSESSQRQTGSLPGEAEASRSELQGNQSRGKSGSAGQARNHLKALHAE